MVARGALARMIGKGQVERRRKGTRSAGYPNQEGAASRPLGRINGGVLTDVPLGAGIRLPPSCYRYSRLPVAAGCVPIETLESITGVEEQAQEKRPCPVRGKAA
jgi:hypothetical protein